MKRKALDLTREELAARVGCSAATIRKIEAEERRPSAQIAGLLAKILNIPAEEQAAFLRSARGDRESVPHELSENVPWRASTVAARSNLPAATTSLIGREQEIALVRGYLLNMDIRLVTLIGPPGIGKTRLSLEVGRTMMPDFPDGVFFVTLASLEEPSLLASTILHTIGYVEIKNMPARNEIMDGIGDKRMLLILDNCEHLVEPIAFLVSELLAACPHLKILVTSREALSIPGEWLYPVPALETPRSPSSIDMGKASRFPALTLFAERARAVRPDFKLTEGNVQAVASICAQLDGLPLTIELIAVRMRLMSPQALQERLTDTFLLSADGRRAVSVRQKTLGNAISWSYNALLPEEQKMFACLAVFAGGFTLEAAESIFASITASIAPGKSVSDLISSLSDKSLLQKTPDDRGEMRFSMLFILQHFAMNALRDMGYEAEARNLHLAYFLELAEKGAEETRGPAQAEWLEWLENEHDNFRSALEWSTKERQVESALRLLSALGWPWEVRGHYREARDWFDKICILPEIKQYPGLYTRVLNHIGRHCWTQENHADARLFLKESQAISLQIGADGEQSLAEALNWLGLVNLFVDRKSDQAKSMLEQGLGIYQRCEDQKGIALSTFHLGIVESILDHGDEALSLLEQSLFLFRQFGDLFFIARVSLFIGFEFLKRGDFEKAQHFYEQQLDIDRKLKFWNGIADGWQELGELYRRRGEYEQASRCFEETVRICGNHGLTNYESFYLSGLAALHCHNYSLAYQRFRHLLNLSLATEQKARLGICLTGLAAVARGENFIARAVKLNAAAQAAYETLGGSYPPDELAEFVRLIQSSRDLVGDEPFQVLVAEGRAMSLEQAVAYALETEI